MTDPTSFSYASVRSRPRGAVRLLRIGGVPVFLHWSSVAGGLALSAGSGFDPRVIPWTILGYMLVIMAHEAGHALAARSVGLQVYAIRLRGLGGRCLVQAPGRARDAFFVYSAGLAAQLMLFGFAMFWLHRPHTHAGPASAGLFFTFIAGNAFTFLSSLWPSTSREGLQSDGRVLLNLALDRWRGRVYAGATLPGIQVASESPVFPSGTSLLEIESLVPHGFVHGLEVLNDRHTPFEFVIGVFERHLGWSTRKAVEETIGIHNAGGLLVPLPSLAEAERIASAIAKDAAEARQPFVCRAVVRRVQKDG